MNKAYRTTHAGMAHQARGALDTQRRELASMRRDELPTLLCSMMCLVLLIVTFVEVTNMSVQKHARKVLDALGHDSCQKHRVLVTGFERFGNFTFENPSKVAAVALNGTCGKHYCTSALILSVDSTGAGLPMRKLAGVSALLHLGFEDAAKGLKLEVIAKNLVGKATNPRWGTEVDCTAEIAAVANGPCLEATTAPLDRMLLRSWGSNDTKEIWSRDPGAFICNEVYYRSLHAIRSNRLTIPHVECELRSTPVQPTLIPALFVHLPNPGNVPLDDYLPVLKEIVDILGEPPLLGVKVPVQRIGRR